MHPRFGLCAPLVLLGLSAIGCSGPVTPSQNTVQTITGSLQPGSFGIGNPNFVVTRNGEYSVTLVSLNPSVSVFVQVSLGVFDQGRCLPSGAANTMVARGQVALQGSIPVGTSCVYVFNQVPSVLTTETAFTLSVSHP